jgi:hypothetical protein
VPGPSKGRSRIACPRCNAQMVEMVRTEPSGNEPGLIWLSACRAATTAYLSISLTTPSQAVNATEVGHPAEILGATRAVGSLSRHACKLGLEGIVSKRKGSPYRSRRSPIGSK